MYASLWMGAVCTERWSPRGRWREGKKKEESLPRAVVLALSGRPTSRPPRSRRIAPVSLPFPLAPVPSPFSPSPLLFWRRSHRSRAPLATLFSSPSRIPLLFLASRFSFRFSLDLESIRCSMQLVSFSPFDFSISIFEEDCRRIWKILSIFESIFIFVFSSFFSRFFLDFESIAGCKLHLTFSRLLPLNLFRFCVAFSRFSLFLFFLRSCDF